MGTINVTINFSDSFVAVNRKGQRKLDFGVAEEPWILSKVLAILAYHLGKETQLCTSLCTHYLHLFKCVSVFIIILPLKI